MTNKKLKPYIKVMPVVFIVLFVLSLGIFGALIQSFGYFPIIGLNKFTLEYYKAILGNSEFINSLLFTLKISLISSVTAVFLGVLIAKMIVDSNIKMDFLVKIPIVIPHVIVALFAITFLSESGIFARLLYAIGFENSQKLFSNILFSHNGLGIILAYLWKEIPYVAITVIAILRRMSGKYEMIATNLGASKLYTFWKITLPMILSTIISTFTIVFAFSFGSYELPMLLGSTTPKALSVLAFIEYENPMLDNRSYAMAINIVIIFASIFFVYLFNTIIRKIVLGGESYE